MLLGAKGEIKKIGGNKAKTANQVRPWKYTVLVVYNELTNQWYVVPAHEVVIFAYGRTGQHCYNSFEVCTLCINEQFDRYITSADNLRQNILAAIEEDRKHAEFAKAMDEVRKETVELAKKHKDMIGKILHVRH